MKLNEFATLAAAKTHTDNKGRILSAAEMRVLMGKHGLYDFFTDPAAQGVVKAAKDNLEKGDPFDFIESSDMCITPMLDGLIAAVNTDTATKLTALKAECVALANVTAYPYENITQHEYERSRNETPKKAIEVTQKGYVSITITGPCELHRPQIYKKVGDAYARIAGFEPVDSPCSVAAQAPVNAGDTVYVDDTYGVIQ